ncbi:hypothetical protein KDI_10600 [Dictyobacter arantiisoli]|uniref:Uncharacterized protein n=1 Tax=Dictyobacter arantiisoli TaxID=2014874 RepID=A0A5A5T8K0_9CHLR|nr:hypothetical protein KDI_10600 [Dictyobacter arantiisoli]
MPRPQPRCAFLVSYHNLAPTLGDLPKREYWDMDGSTVEYDVQEAGLTSVLAAPTLFIYNIANA